MPRGRKHFHALKKVKVRQTWNKYNLYNLSRLTQPSTISRTFFQQKWSAKSIARAYHGEHIREGQWTRMFNRYLPAVVPMDAAELAKDDGAVQGAGRGSGKDIMPPPPSGDESRQGRTSKKDPTPYMGMTFYPQERRLDIAIFRAMFASSARQARQYVVHGFVKVNGKKMQYPGYLLNPGDMFSVDPEMVLFATSTHGKKGSLRPPEPESKRNFVKAKPEAVKEVEEAIEQEEDVEEEEDSKEVEEAAEAQDTTEADLLLVKKALVRLRKDVKFTETNMKKDMSAKRKQDLRALSKDLKTAIAKYKTVTSDMQVHWEKWYADILKAIDLRVKPPPSVAHLFPQKPEPQASETKMGQEVIPEDALTTEFGRPKSVNEAISEHLETLMTYPNTARWFPRHYMSAFAFIPRYLEVNQNVCSAVYLRHPVARPGLAEVPSPFGAETGLLAFQWYLRRR